LGSLIAGPLADWAHRSSLAALARWRWRLVVWARVIETLALGLVIWMVWRGTFTIGRALPYSMVSAFMKTALRPTRGAFEVDLLRREEVQLDAQGATVLDERGQPRAYKVHLLSFSAMTTLLRSAAAFGGLVLGGKIMSAAHGDFRLLFGF